MKKQLMIPAILITGSLAIFSCNIDGENKSEMKTPIEQKDYAAVDIDEIFTTEYKNDAKTNTITNMQAAFKEETNATAKYSAFSKKAREEGYNEIAMLFKSASMSENIHAANHKAVLDEMRVTGKPVTPGVTVKSTIENLEFAIRGEAYEVAEMYPAFLKEAKNADNQLALISLNYACKTEKKHTMFYEKALAALNNNMVNTLPTQYFICPTCGNTYENAAPIRCGISMTGREKFITINSL